MSLTNLLRKHNLLQYLILSSVVGGNKHAHFVATVANVRNTLFYNTFAV